MTESTKQPPREASAKPNWVTPDKATLLEEAEASRPTTSPEMDTLQTAELPACRLGSVLQVPSLNDCHLFCFGDANCH